MNTFKSLPQLNTPSSSMTSTVIKKQNETTSLLNTDYILEISKTAQLLSNQLLMLHNNLAQQTNTSNSLELTPLSSGYNSICSSYENISLSSVKYASKEYTPKNQAAISEQNSSLNSSGTSSDSNMLKRVLFDSDMDDSISTPVSDSSFSSSKKRKFQRPSEFTTPYKEKRPQPSIPRIKEVRKRLKKLTSVEKSKLRKYYNEFSDID